MDGLGVVRYEEVAWEPSNPYPGGVEITITSPIDFDQLHEEIAAALYVERLQVLLSGQARRPGALSPTNPMVLYVYVEPETEVELDEDTVRDVVSRHVPATKDAISYRSVISSESDEGELIRRLKSGEDLDSVELSMLLRALL